MRPEHPETDAGERDGTQRVSAGHVQEEVAQLLSSVLVISETPGGEMSS